MAYEYYLTNLLLDHSLKQFLLIPPNHMFTHLKQKKSTKEKENMLRILSIMRLLKTLQVLRKHEPKIKKDTRNLKLFQEENKTLFDDITHYQYKRKIIFIL